MDNGCLSFNFLVPCKTGIISLKSLNISRAEMKILKARIKKTSIHYKKGLNPKGKSIWLSITGFNTHGEHNFKIKAIKGIKNGFAEYIEIWMGKDDLTFKQIDDGQLSLDIFSKEEEEENKYNPRYFNQRRFEVTTKNSKFYLHAPNLEMAKRVAADYGLAKYKVVQVARLTKKELGE